MSETVLVCNSCGAEVQNAADLGFGFRGTPRVGDTHVCDRFEYGRLVRRRKAAVLHVSAPSTAEGERNG